MNKTHPEAVPINVKQLLDLLHWARRYADHRCTYVPSDFNKTYDAIIAANPFLSKLEQNDETLMENGKYFPYAQDGNFCPNSGSFDARPRHITNKL